MGIYCLRERSQLFQHAHYDAVGWTDGWNGLLQRCIYDNRTQGDFSERERDQLESAELVQFLWNHRWLFTFIHLG